MNARNLAIAAGLGLAACTAQAQSSVTLYGSVDQYLSYLRSSSGAHVLALEDGTTLRSRFGFRGEEDLGGGIKAKFQLEAGFNADSGIAADATRGFDRQTWVGFATPYGEFRFGRQNGVVFYRGDYIDFTSRTLGSVVNAFGTPSRYDNDLSYISPRMAGFLFEAHYALGETTAGATRQGVYQAGLDYLNGPFRVGYAGIVGRPPANAAIDRDASYHNFYANYDYGHGKVYAVYIKSNNNTASGVLANGGTLLGNVGGVVAGTNPEATRYYQIAQLSADYNVTPALRIGALYGRIKDTSGNGKNATGYAIGAYYNLSKRTTLVALAHVLDNDPAAGFRPSGSAGIRTNFTAAADVNGQTIRGVALGVIHRF
ncbi:MAG: polymerase [Ramlibacter sp.]|jgi:predicted porin|nr:polymerase [Ramlibacter sp.]MDB5912802.1 polymerase [Ramlibacter sp.]